MNFEQWWNEQPVSRDTMGEPIEPEDCHVEYETIHLKRIAKAAWDKQDEKIELLYAEIDGLMSSCEKHHAGLDIKNDKYKKALESILKHQEMSIKGMNVSTTYYIAKKALEESNNGTI